MNGLKFITWTDAATKHVLIVLLKTLAKSMSSQTFQCASYAASMVTELVMYVAIVPIIHFEFEFAMGMAV